MGLGNPPVGESDVSVWLGNSHMRGRRLRLTRQTTRCDARERTARLRYLRARFLMDRFSRSVMGQEEEERAAASAATAAVAGIANQNVARCPSLGAAPQAATVVVDD